MRKPFGIGALLASSLGEMNEFRYGTHVGAKAAPQQTGNWISGMPCFREAAMCQGYV